MLPYSPHGQERLDRPRVSVKTVAAESLRPIWYDEPSYRFAAGFDATIEIMGDVSEVYAGHRTATYLYDGLLGSRYPLNGHLRPTAFVFAQQPEAIKLLATSRALVLWLHLTSHVLQRLSSHTDTDFMRPSTIRRPKSREISAMKFQKTPLPKPGNLLSVQGLKALHPLRDALSSAWAARLLGQGRRLGASIATRVHGDTDSSGESERSQSK